MTGRDVLAGVARPDVTCDEGAGVGVPMGLKSTSAGFWNGITEGSSPGRFGVLLRPGFGATRFVRLVAGSAALFAA